jgi:hypothetical protein
VAVYCFDVHGHGESEPKEPQDRGLIRSYKHLVRTQACSPGPVLAATTMNLMASMQYCHAAYYVQDAYAL